MPAPRIAKGGTRKTVFGTVAGLRIHDAKILLRNGRNNGAIYLAGYAVECQVIDSKIGRMKVVRVITPAWKTLTPSTRIFKLLRVTNARLTEAERDKILRFSVLTPEELDRVNGKFPRKAAAAA